MTVEKRIRMCLFIERLNEHKEVSERLGIKDVSRFRGEKIVDRDRIRGERRC